MNEELARTYSLMLKVSFFVILLLVSYYYIPDTVWIWMKQQAEWGWKLFTR